MADETTDVVFANKKLEDDFRRLARSQDPEDRKTYRILQRIRGTVAREHTLGAEIPKENIPSIYVRMFDIWNLWSLKTPPHGTVLYTKVGNELRIVDIV